MSGIAVHGSPSLCRDPRAYVLAALALVVYLPAIWWGLPMATSAETIRGWDVDGVTGMSTLAEIHNLVSGGSEDWFVAYPLFHYLVLGLFYAPYLAWLWITGGLKQPTSDFPYGFADPVTAIAFLGGIGRVVTLTMAVGVVLAVYRSASIVWDRRAGFAAAVITMLSLPMVYRARTGNLDVPVLFWTALGVVVLAAIAVRGFTVRRAILVGVLAALSTATKDQAYSGWVGAIAVLFILHWRGLLPTPEGGAGRLWKAPLALVLSGLVCYAVAGGFAIHPHRFLAHVHFILTYKEARFAFPETNLQRSRDLGGLLQLGRDIAWTTCVAIGVPAAMMALAGIVQDRKSRFLWLLGGMAAGYLLLVMIPIAHMQLRYSLLLVFLLSFPAGSWVTRAFFRGDRARVLAGAGAVLALGWLGANAFNLTYQMWRDARYEAGNWLARNLSRGLVVGFYGDKGQLPAIPEGVRVERMVAREVKLAKAPVDVLLVVPDYTSPPGFERSLFLPESDYTSLVNGKLPYELAARFEVAPPWGGRFPFVNPPVQVFVRSGLPVTGTQVHSPAPSETIPSTPDA